MPNEKSALRNIRFVSGRLLLGSNTCNHVCSCMSHTQNKTAVRKNNIVSCARHPASAHVAQDFVFHDSEDVLSHEFVENLT